MATSEPPGEDTLADDQGADALERIADPENYNSRRRLKQLHDAKERVQETKREAIQLARQDHTERVRRFTTQDRDRLVAEATVDYVDELVPILDQTGDLEAFLAEQVEDNQTVLTVREYRASRGTEPNGPAPVNYALSMAVWRVSNQYFEQVAGADFEDQGLDHHHLG